MIRLRCTTAPVYPAATALRRSCEYLNLLSPEWDGAKKEALERMPVMDEQTFRERYVGVIGVRMRVYPPHPNSCPNI